MSQRKPKQSAKEAVRRWREFMREELGPDFLQQMRETFDREDPNWQSVEFRAYDKRDRLMVCFVMLARGGFEGERIPAVPDDLSE